MPQLSIIKNYADNTVLTAEQLSNAFDSISEFMNDTKLDSDNIQAGSIGPESLQPLSITAAQIAPSTITLSKLAQEIIDRLHQPGDLKPTASTTVDPGWLYCNGAAVSRSTYATLFSKIGIAHGYGDNSTTFNIPDYRGWFLRGQDDGQGVDPGAGGRTAAATGGNAGDLIGSAEASDNLSHSHSITDPAHAHTYTKPSVVVSGGGPFAAGLNLNVVGVPDSTSANYTGINATDLGGGGTESRPQNKNVRWYIKT